jgi:hypothetical protein
MLSVLRANVEDVVPATVQQPAVNRPRQVVVRSLHVSVGAQPRLQRASVGPASLRGKGPASALAYLPRHFARQPKASAGSSLDAVKLTPWSFCFRRQTHTWWVGVVIAEDGPKRNLFRLFPNRRRNNLFIQKRTYKWRRFER